MELYSESIVEIRIRELNTKSFNIFMPEFNIEISDILARCSLFNSLETDHLNQTAKISSIKRIKKGSALFFENEKASGFYVLASGKVKIFKLSSDGREQILHFVEPGQTFAEAAIFEGSFYPANAQALENSILVFIPRNEFLLLIKKDFNLSLGLMASMARWLKRMTDLVEQISLKNIEARIAGYVIDLCKKKHIPLETGKEVVLDVNKSVLASRLGTISETLSRTLKKMEENKIISVKGKTIIIKNADRLTNTIKN